MKFIINQDVIFSSDDGVIAKGDDSFQFPIVCAKIFAHLLNHNNTKVHRNDLLEKGWEDSGLNSSNNSLNNYISLIRRKLKDFGVQDLLVTIPKYGFMVKIECLIIESDVNETQHQTQTSHKIRVNSKRNIIYFSSSILFVLISFLSYYLFFKQHYQGYDLFQRLYGCDIFISDNVHESRLVDYLKTKRAKQILSSCRTETAAIFFDDGKDNEKSMYKTKIFSYCVKNPVGNVNECENHVDVNYE